MSKRRNLSSEFDLFIPASDDLSLRDQREVMERHEMMAAMTDLGSKGMAGAFDEPATTGVRRKRAAMEILTDLLRAEVTHRHAALVRYRISAGGELSRRLRA